MSIHPFSTTYPAVCRMGSSSSRGPTLPSPRPHEPVLTGGFQGPLWRYNPSILSSIFPTVFSQLDVPRKPSLGGAHPHQVTWTDSFRRKGAAALLWFPLGCLNFSELRQQPAVCICDLSVMTPRSWPKLRVGTKMDREIESFAFWLSCLFTGKPLIALIIHLTLHRPVTWAPEDPEMLELLPWWKGFIPNSEKY